MIVDKMLNCTKFRFNNKAKNFCFSSNLLLLWCFPQSGMHVPLPPVDGSVGISRGCWWILSAACRAAATLDSLGHTPSCESMPFGRTVETNKHLRSSLDATPSVVQLFTSTCSDTSNFPSTGQLYSTCGTSLNITEMCCFCFSAKFFDV